MTSPWNQKLRIYPHLSMTESTAVLYELLKSLKKSSSSKRPRRVMGSFRPSSIDERGMAPRGREQGCRSSESGSGGRRSRTGGLVSILEIQTVDWREDKDDRKKVGGKRERGTSFALQPRAEVASARNI